MRHTALLHPSCTAPPRISCSYQHRLPSTCPLRSSHKLLFRQGCTAQRGKSCRQAEPSVSCIYSVHDHTSEGNFELQGADYVRRVTVIAHTGEHSSHEQSTPFIAHGTVPCAGSSECAVLYLQENIDNGLAGHAKVNVVGGWTLGGHCATTQRQGRWGRDSCTATQRTGRLGTSCTPLPSHPSTCRRRSLCKSWRRESTALRCSRSSQGLTTRTALDRRRRTTRAQGAILPRETATTPGIEQTTANEG